MAYIQADDNLVSAPTFALLSNHHRSFDFPSANQLQSLPSLWLLQAAKPKSRCRYSSVSSVSSVSSSRWLAYITETPWPASCWATDAIVLHPLVRPNTVQSKPQLTWLLDEGLPSRGITPSNTSEVDIELGPALPPSQSDHARVNQAARDQEQDHIRCGMPMSSLTMPRAAYDRSRSPSISRPAAN